MAGLGEENRNVACEVRVVDRPAWEAMHAPSSDGQVTRDGLGQPSIPAHHVIVGPGAHGARPP